MIVHELAQPAVPGSSSRIVVEIENGRGDDSAVLNWAIDEAVLRSASVEAVFDCLTSSDNMRTTHQSEECDELASDLTRFTSSYVQSQTEGALLAPRARCVSALKALLDACQGAELLVISEVALEGTHQWGRGSLLHQCVHLAPL